MGSRRPRSDARDRLGGAPWSSPLIFDRQIRSNTKGTFRTRVVTRGTDVTVDVNYRDSRIKHAPRRRLDQRLVGQINWFKTARAPLAGVVS